MGANSGAQCFRTDGGIPSGPGGLVESNDSSSWRTFLVVNWGVNKGYVRRRGVGICDDCGMVELEAKWEANSSALSEGVDAMLLGGEELGGKEE